MVLAQHKGIDRPGTISLRSLPTGRELANTTPDTVVTRLNFADNNDSILLVGEYYPRTYYGEGTSLFLWRWREQNLQVLSKDQLITDVAVSPDGSFFVTNEGRVVDNFSGDRPEQIGKLQLRIWHTVTGKLLRTIPLNGMVHDIAFSSDGSLLAAPESQQVNVFDTSDWSVIKHFKTEFPSNFRDVHFSEDHQLIVPGQQGITLWNSSRAVQC